MEAHRVGDRLPERPKPRRCAFRRREILHHLAIRIRHLGARCAAESPAGESVALARKFACRQWRALAVCESRRRHLARAAVGFKLDRILDPLPDRVKPHLSPGRSREIGYRLAVREDRLARLAQRPAVEPVSRACKEVARKRLLLAVRETLRRHHGVRCAVAVENNAVGVRRPYCIKYRLRA